MKESEYGLWLLVVAIVSIPLILVIWIGQVKKHYNRLKQENTPNPLFVILKQLSFKNLLLFPLNLIKGSARSLKNRRIWLEWDIRWVGAGSTLGRIEDVSIDVDKHNLLVSLDKPIALNDLDKPKKIIISRIIFSPYRKSTNVLQYKLRSIGGTLLPEDESEAIKHLISSGYLATCNVVVY